MRRDRYLNIPNLLAVCSVIAASPAVAMAGETGFSIPPMPLDAALRLYAVQSGDQIMVPAGLAAPIRSGGANGELSRDEALRRILRGSGLEAVRSPHGVVSFRRIALNMASPTATAFAREADSGGAPEALPAPPVAAAEGFDQIVVTARRKDEALQEVPIAITALSGDALVSRGVTKAAEITASVPGVFSAPGSNRGSDSPVFSIRGQLNRDPTLTADPSIGLYFAEVPWARPQGTNAAFFDLQSVQVLKGPQGTLFGRNSTAGAILITPKAPADVFEGYAKFGAGTYDELMAEAVLNVPLSQDAAIRIGGTYERRDGYLTNVTSGQKMNDLDNGSLRASLKLDPTDRITMTFIGTYFKSSTNGDGSRLIGISPASPSAGVAGVYNRLAAALAATNALGKYEYLSSFAPSVAAVNVSGVPQVFQTSRLSKVETWGAQHSLTIDMGESPLLGEVSIKNIIGYRHEKDMINFETAAVPFLNAQILSRQRSQQFSEELQLQGKRGAVDYVIGAFYFRESGHLFENLYAVAPVSTILDGHATNTAYSAFAHANIDLSSAVLDGLGLTMGARLTRDERELVNANRRQTTPGVVANPMYTCFLVAVAPNDGSQCGLARKVRFTEPTWDIGINYKLARGSLLYASIGHGYRSGGFSIGAQSIAATAPYQPEKVLNYEIGSKNDFNIGGMATRVNLAGFYTDYSNIQRTINFILPSGSVGNLTVNAAKAHILGGEVEITAKPVSNLEIGFSYTYLKPKYDEFTDNYREPTNGIIYPVDVSDSQFILVSRHSLAANARYTLPLPPSSGEISFLASYYYRTGFYTTSDINTASCSVPNNPNPAAFYANCLNRLGRLPGYGLLNLRAEWQNVLGKGFDVAVFVNNVTDKYYFPNALNALSLFGANSAQIGAPRMAGMTVSIPFGGN